MPEGYWNGVPHMHGGGVGMGGEGLGEPRVSLIMRKGCPEDLIHGMSNNHSGLFKLEADNHLGGSTRSWHRVKNL